MIRCLGPGCNRKIVSTERAHLYRMCEPCLEGGLKEIDGLRRQKTRSLLPVLFYADFHTVVDRLEMRKKLKDLGLLLDLQATSLRVHLCFPKRRRLPGWLAHALYKPLYRTCGVEWLSLLPVRVSLACHSALRRKYRRKPFQEGPSISVEDFLSRHLTFAGSARIPKALARSRTSLKQ